ncbi:endoplasmic reticulum-Golgi intermediate compartment protein 2 [Lingula anatina]|uniref:Endoplasmic reticulum-Golgi intermediate compartment protein 2 n=1 Tax=Lingula anatina TaxID=7574 RepID=A0A1S3JAM7_LINAN|nr:endoplasmic reticulum-Golgi intermediate compartment protein 2 [Lingula anatina]|eukprot:XP_013407460.1 endoplasmic reticulum-Golgi intermediate compartment protein 2 [Lingula anatina]
MLRKRTLKIVKELDAFPKVPKDYAETGSSGGGAVSILIFLVMAALVVSEIMNYVSTEMHFNYEVDAQIDRKLKINVDITVAMACDALGADIVELTDQGSHTEVEGQLEQDPVHFELSDRQRQYFATIQHVNTYLRNQYHAIQAVLWKSGYSGMGVEMPRGPLESVPGEAKACRLHGSIYVNKVSGNFHITAGKSIPHPRGHVHLTDSIYREDHNFSHRIERLSFGEVGPGVVSPLDGDEVLTTEPYKMFQYFIQIVPTKVRTLAHSVDTYQFSVTTLNRTIDHSLPGHGGGGAPGIFFKYKFSPLTVIGTEERKSVWKFTVRLCGIVGGIFSTAGLLQRLCGYVTNLLLGHFSKQQHSSS